MRKRIIEASAAFVGAALGDPPFFQLLSSLALAALCPAHIELRIPPCFPHPILCTLDRERRVVHFAAGG